MKRTIIVTGIGRCGTSAVAGALNIMGVPMYNDDPDNIEKANFAAPRRQWEDLKFQRINERILRGANDCQWWYDIPEIDHILEVGEDPEYKEFMKKVVGDRDKKYDVWGAKDPRFSMTYPIIRPYLRNPHVILCGRNATETIKSVARAFSGAGWPLPPEMITFWASVTARSMNMLYSTGDPIHVVSFDRLMKKPKKALTDIAKFVGKKLTNEALEFIDPGLRNFDEVEDEKEEE